MGNDEMVDVLVSKTSVARREGSTPSFPTMICSLIGKARKTTGSIQKNQHRHLHPLLV